MTVFGDKTQSEIVQRIRNNIYNNKVRVKVGNYLKKNLPYIEE